MYFISSNLKRHLISLSKQKTKKTRDRVAKDFQSLLSHYFKNNTLREKLVFLKIEKGKF